MRNFSLISSIIFSMVCLVTTSFAKNGFEGTWKCTEKKLGLNYILHVDEKRISLKLYGIEMKPVRYEEIKIKENGENIHAILWDMENKQDWYLMKKESGKYFYGWKGDHYPCTKKQEEVVIEGTAGKFKVEIVKDIIINGSNRKVMGIEMPMPDRNGLLNANKDYALITDAEIDLVSNFIANGMTGPGANIFAGTCASCHMEDGKGMEYIAPGLVK